MKQKKYTIKDNICLNVYTNGVHTSVQDRIYWCGGVSSALTTSFHNWICYAEEDGIQER